MIMCTDEVYEHEAVHSTDRLEKPRHRPGYSSCTLPRKQMNFNANSQGNVQQHYYREFIIIRISGLLIKC